LYLQCCAKKIHDTPEITELLFTESRKFAHRRRAGVLPNPGPGVSWPHTTRRHSSALTTSRAAIAPTLPRQNPPAPGPPQRRAATRAKIRRPAPFIFLEVHEVELASCQRDTVRHMTVRINKIWVSLEGFVHRTPGDESASPWFL
jgi:hypothetical protein